MILCKCRRAQEEVHGGARDDQRVQRGGQPAGRASREQRRGVLGEDRGRRQCPYASRACAPNNPSGTPPSRDCAPDMGNHLQPAKAHG